MSDPSQQPITSGLPGPPPIQPTSSRTIRKRRPTAIPQDVTEKKEVKILRPSEVPEREPMPEYKPYGENRKTIPNNVPLDQLHTHYDNEERKIVLPDFMTAEELIELAEKSKEVISFRSTNHVDPDIIWRENQANEAKGKRKTVDDFNIEWRRPVEEQEVQVEEQFIERSKNCIGRKVHGVFTMVEKTDSKHLRAILEGPKGSLYEGGTFFIKIAFYVHPKFHYIVPHVQFETMMFHPSLSKHGAYDVRGLVNSDWNQKSSLEDVYKWLVADMKNLKRSIEQKNQEQLEDMAQPDIALLASTNWKQFEKIARDMTAKMAGGALSMSKLMPGRLRELHEPPKKRKMVVAVDEEYEVAIDVETVDEY